jgi:uncharacterized membrane protein YkvA (DUF1232 family)
VLPVIGLVDDLVLIPLLVAWLVRLLPGSAAWLRRRRPHRGCGAGQDQVTVAASR